VRTWVQRAKMASGAPLTKSVSLPARLQRTLIILRSRLNSSALICAHEAHTHTAYCASPILCSHLRCILLNKRLTAELGSCSCPHEDECHICTSLQTGPTSLPWNQQRGSFRAAVTGQTGEKGLPPSVIRETCLSCPLQTGGILLPVKSAFVNNGEPMAPRSEVAADRKSPSIVKSAFLKNVCSNRFLKKACG
jgi:hypothetical protein